MNSRRETILVVEDDPAMRTFYRSALRMEGYSVITVEDGLDALRWMEGDVPDLLILDMALPRVAGRDVLHEVKAHAETRNIPIMIVSGTETRGFADEVACVMRKPVTADELIAAVEKCLAIVRLSSSA